MPMNNFLILSDLDSLGGLSDLNGLSGLKLIISSDNVKNLISRVMMTWLGFFL